MIRREDFVIECIQEEQLLGEPEAVLLHKYHCNYLLLIHEEQNQAQLLFVSGSKKIRAVEIMEYLLPGFGLVRGDATRATGIISLAILKSQISDSEMPDAVMYFEKVVEDYIENTLCIVAEDYAAQNAEAIYNMTRYSKKRNKWAMVKSTDIAEPGQAFVVNSLENESGEEVIASEEIYIMIGCRGEIYCITAEKFHNTYEVTEEKLDVFEEMMDYIPEVRLVASGEYIAVDEKARICYPQSSVQIYAKQLQGRTKVFQGRGDGEYFLGRAGDYMAIRVDDIRDMYIIQKEIFEQTYEG